MGKPARDPSAPPSPPNYRDDPDAVSLHTTSADYEYDGAILPSYSDLDNGHEAGSSHSNVHSSPSNGGALSAPSINVNQYQSITPPSGKRGPWQWRTQTPWTTKAGIGCETSMRMNEQLMISNELYNYVSVLRLLPVKPMLNIHGWHNETRRKDNKTESERVTDFDIHFNLQKFMNLKPAAPWWTTHIVENGTSAYRGGFRKSKARSATKVIDVESAVSDVATPSLQAWCDEFCKSKATLRVFRIARTFTGFDLNVVREQIEQIIRNTHYHGHIEISLTLIDRNVDIYSPHWINRARISWVRWIFYFTFLWLLTWPLLFFFTKWWCVYTVEWRWSRGRTEYAPHSEEDVTDDQPRVERWTRQYACLSENEWCQRHASLIASLALEQFSGEATDLPTGIAADHCRRNSGIPLRNPITAAGNPDVDSAIGFLQTGTSVWNFVSRGSQVGENFAWGMDS